VVYKARPIISPNPAFWCELEIFERMLMQQGSGTETNSNIPSSLPYFWMVQVCNTLMLNAFKLIVLCEIFSFITCLMLSIEQGFLSKPKSLFLYVHENTMMDNVEPSDKSMYLIYETLLKKVRMGNKLCSM
jgi:hypothetical protein